MTHTFDTEAVAGVLGHMNTDHADDNLLIVRAYGAPEAVSAEMTGVDGAAGHWDAVSADGSRTAVDVPWPGGEITERAQVRRAVVMVYREACARLGVSPRAEH